MRRIYPALLVIAFMVSAPHAARAQTTLGIGAQYMDFGGSDFDGTDGGFGLEGRVMFPAGKSALVGGGIQYSSHNEASFSNNIAVLGILGEGRYQFPTKTGKVTPYVAGRLGWAKASVSEDLDGDGIDDHVKWSGIAFGAGGGLLVATGATSSFDFGLVLHSVSFGDATVNGTSVSDTKLSGTAFQFRAGMSFKVGGK